MLGRFYILLLFTILFSCGRGQEDGLVQEFHANGKIKSELSYKNGKVNGLLRTWFDNGQLHDSSMVIDGKPIGLSVSYYKNGQKNYEVFWDSTFEKSGISRHWYPNGILASERNYVSGQIHGIWTSYFENGGMKFMIGYQRGDKDGVSIYFDEEGDTSKVELYERGKLIKRSVN